MQSFGKKGKKETEILGTEIAEKTKICAHATFFTNFYLTVVFFEFILEILIELVV